jgi:type I restriction enzyme, S subunit
VSRENLEEPEGWTLSSLTDVADVLMGQSPPGSTYNTSGDGLPFFQGKAEFGDNNPVVRKWCTSPTRVAEPGDILMSVRAPVGPTNIADQRCAIGRGLAAIRSKPGVPASIVRHAIKLQEDEIASWGTGTTFTAINRKHFRDIRVPLPPVGSRESLAKLLDRTVVLRRSSIAHLAASRRVVERFRQAVLAAACAGRLTADWRVDHSCDPVGPGPALSAQAAANASGAPNTDDLVQIPEAWGWWTIEGITERVIDYRGRTPPNQSSGPIPHVRTTQIRDGRIDWQTDRFVTRDVYDVYMTRGIPKRDDVLFTMEAPMGEVGIVDRDEPFSIAQRILLMRPGDHITGDFLALALRSHPVRRAMEYRSTGTGVLGIAYKRLRSVRLPIPPIEEQDEIVRRTSKLLATIDRLQQRIDAASARVDRSSQAVLAKAFRGELLPAGPGIAAEPEELDG